MKKLTRFFQTQNGALRAAIREDDTALMQKLLHKKSDRLFFDLYTSDVLESLTPRMADVVVSHVAAGNSIQWSFRNDHALRVPALMACHALHAKNEGLLDVLFDGRLPYSKDKIFSALALDLIGSALAGEKKAQYFKKILPVNDKLPEQEKMVCAAVAAEATEVLGVLAAFGVNLRDNNELALREAARNEKRSVCVYLMEKHGADIDVALKAAQDLGAHGVYLYLDNVRQEVCPKPADTEAAPTVESLAREVKELRAALRQMTAMVTEMQAAHKIEKNLDKPGLSARKCAP